MQFIKSIEVRKFRSVRSITKGLEPTSLNVLVGQNDQGKSNILRALNLFFNGETDLGQTFRFEDDYCYHAATGTGTRHEVRIDLIIHPPKERFKHAKPIRWTKKWKRDGTVHEQKLYMADSKPLSGTNNVSKWLDKLRYRYIPAIRGRTYFSKLMGELHDVLNESHGSILSDQGEGFISGIQEITSEITRELDTDLGIPNSIQVPSDFRLLFSNLDFGSRVGDNTYHLKQRGDGIKARHIPIILKYMRDAERAVSIPGYVKPDTIWGFEEPENNLELKYSFDLARTLKKYSRELQIFLTTHSPAFYALDKTDTDDVTTFLISQNQDGCTESKKVTDSDYEELNENMGLLPFVTPLVAQVAEQRSRIDALTENLDRLGANRDCYILSEDEDMTVLARLMEGSGFEVNQCEFHSYHGADQVVGAWRLAKYLNEKNPESWIVVHRDRDYLSEEQVNDFRKRCRKEGIEPYVTSGVDTESEFLTVEHIHSICPSLDVEEIRDVIDSATSETEEKSIGRLIDQYFRNNPPYQGGASKKMKELKELYESDVVRYRYGKAVVGRVKSKLQKLLGSNVNLIVSSDSLEVSELQSIAYQIWEP